MLMFFPLENGVLWQFVVLLALAYRVRAQMSFTLSLSNSKGFQPIIFHHSVHIGAPFSGRLCWNEWTRKAAAGYLSPKPPALSAHRRPQVSHLKPTKGLISVSKLTV